MRLSAYFLTRYPVTAAQWRPYYDAVMDYYEAARVGQPASPTAWKPTRPDGAEFEPLDERSIVSAPTRPVVRVSWYDALDYGAWLTWRLREQIEVDATMRARERRVPPDLARVLTEGDTFSQGRPWVVTLPSEAEWEKGARGRRRWNHPWTAARRPWGDEHDSNKANGRPSGIGHVSASGCFKHGQSAEHVEEALGNVWEWTRSLGGRGHGIGSEYPYEPDYDGRGRENVKAAEYERRVVRGGSFFYYPGDLRSANRDGYRPRNRHDDLGFRVVVSPFAFDPVTSGSSGL